VTGDLSLHLVTDAALCGERGVVATVDAAVAGGVTVVQLRDKTATDAETVDLLVQLSQIIDGRALLVVNDRLPSVIDARALGARVDGVHLGQSDTSVERARALLGPDALIGLTANTPAHLDALRALPEGTVDYVGVGVIRPTSTKPDHPPALGVDGFRALAASSPVPAVAIGGIGRDDVAALRDAGAAGIAVVSALCAADDPRLAARALRREWRRDRPPRVLSIAGSDPSGGAGIQADLKSIAAHGGYGMAAITALTAQNTRGVRGVHVPPASFLRAQLDAVASDIEIDAVKIGMLADAEIIRTVGDWLAAHRPDTVVLDPVMVATSGDRLLDADAETALLALAHQVDLLTPNLGELAVLAGRPLDTWAEALAAAQEVAALTGALVLAKGGHLPGDETPDALVGSDGVLAEYRGRRIETTSSHGTGCSLSSALAVTRARGMDWVQAVEYSRAWLRESLSAADVLDVGHGHGPISHFAGLWERGGLAARPDADAVREDWWNSIADIRRGIDELPFIRGLADGTLNQKRFLRYLTQDALYLREYARVLAEAARLAPTPQEQAFWAASAQGAIDGELELHASWITPGAGVSAATFSATADATTTAYLDHLRAVAFGGDYAVLIAALLPCFWLYTDLGVRMQAGEFGDRTRDPQHPYSSWLATYADPVFAAATEQAIGHVTRAAAQSDRNRRERMHRAFTTSSAHERAFFDV
jgi:hydroxymethylpyrimidine kinase/phosphomethylpyrimidine kinase/thiamine-phosphate diphosphorylase